MSRYDIELPFQRFEWNKDVKFEDWENKNIEKAKTEKDMNEDEIRNILTEKLKGSFVLNSEKNLTGYNENPFDLVAGNEKTLDIVGIEIKSDRDSYGRLKSQLNAYLFAFPVVFIAIHKKKKPEWLPDGIGFLRVFRDGSVIMEHDSYMKEEFDISTGFEWDALFKANNLGSTSKKTKALLNILASVRKNIIFNRFFAIQRSYDSKDFERFYPFTEEEKTILMGLDIPYHIQKATRDILELERRLAMLKNLLSFGKNVSLKDFIQKESKADK